MFSMKELCLKSCIYKTAVVMWFSPVIKHLLHEMLLVQFAGSGSYLSKYLLLFHVSGFHEAKTVTLVIRLIQPVKWHCSSSPLRDPDSGDTCTGNVNDALRKGSPHHYQVKAASWRWGSLPKGGSCWNEPLLPLQGYDLVYRDQSV